MYIYMLPLNIHRLDVTRFIISRETDGGRAKRERQTTMEGGHGTELLESAGGRGSYGTRSPKIGYQPIIAVVTLRAEPHIRLDNKLWTVHGIWIFTKDTLLTRKVSRTSIAFHQFLRK